MQASGLDGADNGPVIVVNGDNLFDIDLDPLLAQHSRMGHLITLALAPLVSARGIVDTDRQNRVTGFREKPELPYWINAGLYVMDPGVAALLPVKGDHEEQLLPRLAAQGQLAAYKTRQLWRTIDTAKDLATLTRELRAGLEIPCLDWTQTPA
jgi:NDP-sugar pyrophosphorylase family protein